MPGQLGQCVGCPLENRKLVPFVGPRNARICFVGEAPGREEVKKKEPFIGPSGQLFNMILQHLGINRFDIRIGNAILCGPINDEDKSAAWFPEVLSRCALRREAEADIGEAKVIVALGAMAAWGLLGTRIALGGSRPRRGAVHRDKDGRIIIPTWHPAALLRSGGSGESFGGLSDADAETVGLDIKKAWQLSIGEVEEFKPQIQLEANPEVFADWCDWSIEHGSRVAIDIEADSVDPLTCKMTVVGLARRVREIPAVDPALEEAADTESAQQMEAHVRSPKEVLVAGKPGTAETDGPPPVVEVMSFWWPNANDRAREAFRKLLADETIDKVFHNCLTGDSRVWMADGSRVPLNVIVKKKLGGPVLSVNPKTGKVEQKRITGWINNPIRVWADWRRIRVRGKGCLRLTKDHRVWTPQGWKEAGEIRVGDRIRSWKCGLSLAERALVFGSVLGDMSVKPRHRATVLSVAHEERQRAYLQFKSRMLATFSPRVSDSVRYGGFCSRNGTKLWTAVTKADARLNEVADVCLWHGKKRLSDRWVRELSIPALAIWFCDDGSVSNPDRSFSFSACVTSIGRTGRSRLVRHLRTFGWPAVPWTRKEDGQLYIRIRGKRGRGLDPVMDRFWRMIAPFVPTCMAHKLPERFRSLASDSFWKTQHEPDAWFDEVVEVGPLLRRKGETRRYGGYTSRNSARGVRQFCLRVEDNHNFFAEGLLVANCSYDQMALERLVGPIKGGVSDTMLLSHARFPDVEVKLDAVAQTWLAVPPWKNEHYAREAARKAAVASAEQRGKKQKAAVDAGQGAFLFMGDEQEERSDEPDVKLEWSEERVMDLLGYNAMDVAVTSAIEPLLVDECEREKVLEIAAVDVALAQVGWRMTRDGVPLDQEVRQGLKKEIEMRVETSRARMWRIVEEGLLHPVDAVAAERLQKEIQRRGVFNPNADVMLESAFDVCGVKVPASKFSVTAKGKRSFGKKALAEIGDVPLVSALSEYRGTTRLVSTFFGKDTMPIGPDGRMHVPWKIHGTPTGRWASGKEDEDDDVVSINLQNWPGAMRKMVVAPPGMRFVGADFAQLEYRVVALLAGEISLLNLFNDPTRPDLHSTNAARLFGADWEATDPMKAENPFDKEKRKRKRYILRGLTKNGLYGAMYKGSAVTIQKTLQARSLKERDEEFAEAMRRVTKKQCQDFVDAIPRLWPAIEAWREWAIKDVAENQETICPLSGRRRIWPLGMADATQAINTRVQTFAGSLMNERFLYLSTALPKEARIILQVHDSVVIECPEAMAQDVLKITIDTMTTELEIGGNKCLFTVDGKIGNTWAEV